MFIEQKKIVEETGEYQTFEEFESNVRSYCRDFPVMLGTAKESTLYSTDSRSYIDFFMGAGALNYGHNSEPLKKKLLEYIETDGITHSLDFYTDAKREFIETFQDIILRPRSLKYKLQFTGPTGTNAIEAALKLARKVTMRTNVIAFSNAFHGMSLASLSATASPKKRQGAGIPLNGVTFMPYEGYLGADIDSLDYISKMLADGSGVDAPAAFLVETIQGEGGLHHVSQAWLQRLEALARKLGALLIVDDIQSGCGRSGQFFSFEEFGVYPDIVCLSKSLSGYGLPFSLNLINPIHDIWHAGEHNGTFRGNNLAFVTGRAALEEFWRNSNFERALAGKITYLHTRLAAIVKRMQCVVPDMEFRGRGFMCGISVGNGDLAQKISAEAFRLGLIVETCGVYGQVLKLLPALTIQDEILTKGVDILESAFEHILWPKPNSSLRVSKM